MSDPTSAVVVPTYGWDTAFVLPCPAVNTAIVNGNSSPPRFQQTEKTYGVQADFGPWQICQGGDGKAVRMLLPLSDVQISYDKTGGISTYPSGHAIVQVELHYLPHGDPASTATGQPLALKVRSTSDDPSSPVLIAVSLTLNPDPDFIDAALIKQAIQDWGTANLSAFDHTFAVVDLNRQVDQGRWGFLNPNYTSYAYLDGTSLDDSLFAVLCMTGDRSGTNLTEVVNVEAIPKGSKAGFLVSSIRVLLDVVRPAVIGAYPGLNDDNFLLSVDGTELYLESGVSVDLQPVDHDGSTYYPKLTGLTLQSIGSTITLQSTTTTDIGLGLTAECTSTHQYTITLSTAGGGQTLSFQTIGQPSIVHTIHQSEGSQIAEAVIAVVLGLVLVILTVLTDGAALIVAGLVVGLLIGADQLLPPVLKAINTDTSPDIDLLLVNAVDPITWTGSSAFSLDAAYLNGSLQLGGDPTRA